MNQNAFNSLICDGETKQIPYKPSYNEQPLQAGHRGLQSLSGGHSTLYRGCGQRRHLQLFLSHLFCKYVYVKLHVCDNTPFVYVSMTDRVCVCVCAC